MKSFAIISELIKILGEKNVLADEESRSIYGKDLTKNFKPDPMVIVFPKNEQEVINIVQLANATNTGIVPSGGRTGYSGGAVSASKEIVVSLEKFNRILSFNSIDRQVKCEPGVITKTIQDFALNNNLHYPVDFSSSSSSQIGGNIATNAGGIKVIRYGSTRNWIAGLKVITGNGELLNLNTGLAKNNSGYDLRHLFIGSEGTLGIITEATVQLTTIPHETKVLLLGVSSKDHITKIFNSFKSMSQIIAFEFFSELAMQHILRKTKLEHPFSIASSFYILIEYESNDAQDKICLEILEKYLREKIINDAIFSSNISQAKKLWRFREEISMSISEYSPYKYDIAVLPSNIAAFMNDANRLLHEIYPDMEIIWFGHVGDGNLHLNILKPAKWLKEDFVSYCNLKSHEVYRLIHAYEGTISAEHGVGLLKKSFLHYTKEKNEISYMRAIKKIFDPKNIMNPGKIF